jgi:hypothetical protein
MAIIFALYISPVVMNNKEKQKWNECVSASQIARS